MMNRKDNLMAIIHHQSHDHIGGFMDKAGCGGDAEEFENGPAGGSGGLDWFGMEWARNSAGFGGGTPAPGKCTLPDVTEWKKYVKFPDVTKYDWQAQADRQLASFDPKEKVLEYSCWNGPFLRLVDLMIFDNGLMAFFEEPEACAELLNAIVDYRIGTLEYIKKYFNPDVVTIFEDFAHERGLFISPETYDTLISPVHKKWADAVRSYGMIPFKHVCGKCEEVVDRFVTEGFEAWTICQPENDIVGLQEKVGDKLMFSGCWDLQAKWIEPGTTPTEEQLRAKVREAIDLYGPGGNLALNPAIFHPAVNMREASPILSDELNKYGTNYYCK